MTLFSEKTLISHRCICGLMPNFIKKHLGRYLACPLYQVSLSKAFHKLIWIQKYRGILTFSFKPSYLHFITWRQLWGNFYQHSKISKTFNFWNLIFLHCACACVSAVKEAFLVSQVIGFKNLLGFRNQLLNWMPKSYSVLTISDKRKKISTIGHDRYRDWHNT